MGSASQPMLVVRANRALLKKRKSYKNIRSEYEGYLPNTKLKFKELTDFEKKKIRDKIREQAKRDRLKEIKVYVLAFLIISPMIALFIWVFLKYLV
jgi:hypothetical protein